ncbi:MAG: family 1 glycosylhydrolase [Halanaerobiales bacterium]
MLKQKIFIFIFLCFILISNLALAKVDTDYINITFSTNEDYDIVMYGNDEGLEEVEKDFQLVKELGLSNYRVSFSWSNYQPREGQFANFDWLRSFVKLANEYEINLMPYLCYAPQWATTDGKWNSPPKDYGYWYDFVYKMVNEFKDDIDSWELWNEENADMWFSGNKEEFAKMLKVGAEAVRTADPDAQIILGGLVYPDYEFVEFMLENVPETFDVLPIHSYAESWSKDSAESYLSANGRSSFDGVASLLEYRGDGQPIWINEIGYPTIEGNTEEDQANFLRRVLATLMATEQISLISWYEIKDLEMNNPIGVIGDDINYHLGLTDFQRNKKLAFYTYQNIVSIFHKEDFRYLDSAFVHIIESEHVVWPQLSIHPFQRISDNTIYLFVWNHGINEQTEISLLFKEVFGEIKDIFEYSLSGEKLTFKNYDGSQISNLILLNNQARLFEIKLR